MLLKTRRRAGLVGALIGVAALAGACELPVSAVGTTGTPAYVGTFTIAGAQFNGPIDTELGSLDLTFGTGSITLTDTATTFALTGTQNVAVSGSTQWGAVSGNVVAQVSASGTIAAGSGTNLSFSVTSLSGTATFTGTVGGNPVTQTFSLPSSTQFDDLFGLTGTATYTVTSSGINLVFTSFTFNCDHS